MGASAAEGLARDILNKLKAGEDFAELAKQYSEGPNASEGGSMGYVKKGDLLPDIESVVFNMKDGEVSDIIHTKLGYHIFKVDERRERQTLGLAEVKREVEEGVYREKVKDKIKDWVGNLKKNAYISFK
jgi:parvulin-like peptidyl-prolyl isomerase